MRNVMMTVMVGLLLAACDAGTPADVADDEPVAASESNLSMYDECHRMCMDKRSSCMENCSVTDQWCIDGCGGDAEDCSETCHHVWGHMPNDRCYPFRCDIPFAPDTPPTEDLSIWQLCVDGCGRQVERCNDYCVPGQEIDCQVRCSEANGRCHNVCDLWIASSTAPVEE